MRTGKNLKETFMSEPDLIKMEKLINESTGRSSYIIWDSLAETFLRNIINQIQRIENENR